MLKDLFNLFFVFAKIGAVTFGGGYAMLPVFQRELVDNRGWTTEEKLMDYFAISQCTPGVIAVNTATFIGCSRAGIPGGIAATLGVVFPSIVIITVLAIFLQNFAHLEAVRHAFNGIRACVCVLILNSVVGLIKKAVIDYKCLIIYFVVLGLSLFAPVSPVIIVILVGVTGVIIKPAKTPFSGKTPEKPEESPSKKGK
ncbi:MAG: chromate transporter [Lachnospiraceae bacterium]|nr:chromate transporter [Lachnospiraceae bacterium]